MSSLENNKTDFGFEKVSYEEKTNRVAAVFHSVSRHYDLMNDLMSFGLHRLWKRFSVEMASLRPSHVVLDLATGTGDLSLRMASLLGDTGQLFVSDINNSMLAIARKRFIEKGLVSSIHFVQMSAEAISFPNNSFDLVTIAFGLRNVAHKDIALNEIYRVLKPGGKLLILEFSSPTSQLLRKLYDAYSFNVLPLLGKIIANDEQSYRYLAESIRMHPNQNELCNLVATAGFEQCDYHNLMGGIVALHKGIKIV